MNPFTPLTVMSDDQVAHLHQQAVRYLADEGIKVLFDEARSLFAGAGCSVDDESHLVRIDPDVIAAALATSPSEFELHGGAPHRDVHVGGSSVVIAPVGGPPFVSDRLHGRRAGTMEDQRNFLKLTQLHDVLSVTSPCVEPNDVPLNDRHLVSGMQTLTLSDKVPFVYARGRARVRDSLEMVRRRHGLSEEQFASDAYCWTNINTNSPRQIDIPMSMGIIDFARAGQPNVMTPFTLAGAMAPVTLAGALVLQHMEVLAAVTLAQIVRPGAPVLYGAFTSNVDMKSGSPAFGTPEAFRGALASGQLARHVGLPWRSSGSSASTSVDAQAGYETMMNFYGAVLGGANWVMHSAGWQEGGLVASFEKFVTDLEMCRMFAEVCRPLVTDDAELALDAISEVGPGGHFFGTPHTLERFETAFYPPIVFGRTNYEQWVEEGSRSTDERATDVWQRMLTEYEPPEMPADRLADVAEFVERRIAEGGAAPD